GSSLLQNLLLGATCSSVQRCTHRLLSLVLASLVWAPGCDISGHLLYYVRSLWSSPVVCPQSLVISCTVSAVSGHLLYYVCSLWSSPVLCLQSLVISCTMSAVSGHPLYCVCSLWSSHVLCLQSLVISCSMSAVSGHPCTVSAVSGHLL
ncbi:unnamed protein product, partial [Staurois parvus]